MTYKLLNEAKKDDSYQGWKRKTENFRGLFSKTVVTLQEKLKAVEALTQDLIDEAETAEQCYRLAHRRAMDNLLQTSKDQYLSLDEDINHIGSLAVQIVHRLEAHDARQQSARKAICLIKHFQEFNGWNPSEFNQDILPNKKMPLVFTDPSRQQEAIEIVSELNKFVADSKSPRCENGNKNMKLYISHLENELKEEFEFNLEKLRYKDNQKALEEMKKVVILCENLRSTKPCIYSYLDQRFAHYQNRYNWDRDLDPKIKRDLIHYRDQRMEQIHSIFQDEKILMHKIFGTEGISVLKLLLEKIITQVLKPYTYRLLPTLSGNWAESLAHLEMLSSLHECTVSMLKKLDLDEDYRESLIFLMFGFFKEGYIRKELKCQELFFDSKVSKALPMKKKGGEVLIVNPVNPSVVMECLKFTDSALARCKCLSTEHSVGDNLLRIFDHLINCISEYLKRGLYSAKSFLHQTVSGKDEYRLEVAFTILHFEHVAVCNLRTRFEAILESLSPPLRTKAKLSMHNNLYYRLSSLVEDVLNLIVDRMVHHAKTILNPPRRFFQLGGKSQSKMLGDGRSEACRNLLDFLDKQMTLVDSCLFGSNREIFLTCLGVRLYDTIHKHSCSSRNIALNEIAQLVADLSEYERWVQSKFKVPKVVELFERLPLLGKVPVLVASGLHEFIKEELRDKHKIPVQEIEDFLKIRKDYSRLPINLLLSK